MDIMKADPPVRISEEQNMRFLRALLEENRHAVDSSRCDEAHEKGEDGEIKTRVRRGIKFGSQIHWR